MILKGLKAAYPNDNFIPDEYTMNLWYTALQDIPFPVLNRAAQSYMMSNHFPPTIADIRQYAYNLSAPADDIAAEEWSKLMKALSYAGLPEPEAFEYWNRLPDITKQIVGSFKEFKAWSNTDTSELMTVHRPMFIKRFEEKTKTLRMRGSVPNNLQTPMKQLDAEGRPMLEDGRNAYQPGKQSQDLPPGVDKRLAELRRRLSGVKGS